MININIDFTDFTTGESYIKLQEEFLKFDHEYDGAIKIDNPISNSTIIIVGRNFLDNNTTYNKIDFHIDFLTPKILLLCKEEFERFLSQAKKQYTTDLKNGLALEYIDRIRSTKLILMKSSYLSSSTIKALIFQLNCLEENISNYIKDPLPQIKHKIQFNWNRTDVEYFFHLLRINKQIADITDADLGRIIDNFTEYLDEKPSIGYKAINNSRKHLNAFKNTEGRPEQPALKRLMEVFFDKDFYNR